MKRKSLFGTSLIAFLFCLQASAQNDAEIVKDFQNRVQHYASLRSQQRVPNKQTNSPDRLAQQKQEATQKIQQVRPAAMQGDIFTREIAAYFRKQIGITLHGPGGDKIRASLKRAEPLPDVQLKVNAPYPANLPLQSTPPTLLLNLPQLPKGLQYRLVGSTLVLYDETARLVVDLIPDAVA